MRAGVPLPHPHPKRMHNGVFRSIHRGSFEGLFGVYFEAETTHNKRGCRRRQHLVLDIRCLGVSARWKAQAQAPVELSRVAGCGCGCITRGTSWIQARWLVQSGRQGRNAVQYVLQACSSSLPSRHSSAVVAAVRRRATGGPVLRQRAVPAGVNKTYHRHSTNPSGYGAPHEQHSTHLDCDDKKQGRWV